MFFYKKCVFSVSFKRSQKKFAPRSLQYGHRATSNSVRSSVVPIGETAGWFTLSKTYLVPWAASANNGVAERWPSICLAKVAAACVGLCFALTSMFIMAREKNAGSNTSSLIIGFMPRLRRLWAQRSRVRTSLGQTRFSLRQGD